MRSKTKFLTLFAVVLLLASPAAIVEEVATYFGTDSYDEDGCFC